MDEESDSRMKIDPYEPEFDENLVDIRAIRENLAMTPTQRVRQADAFLRELERLRAEDEPD